MSWSQGLSSSTCLRETLYKYFIPFSSTSKKIPFTVLKWQSLLWLLACPEQICCGHSFCFVSIFLRYSISLCILSLPWDLETRISSLLSALFSVLPKEVLCSWLIHIVEMQTQDGIIQLLSFHWLRYQSVSFLSCGKASESSWISPPCRLPGTSHIPLIPWFVYCLGHLVKCRVTLKKGKFLIEEIFLNEDVTNCAVVHGIRMML